MVMDFNQVSGIAALVLTAVSSVASAFNIRRKANLSDEKRLEIKVDQLGSRIQFLEGELARCRDQNISLMKRLVALD